MPEYSLQAISEQILRSILRPEEVGSHGASEVTDADQHGGSGGPLVSRGDVGQNPGDNEYKGRVAGGGRNENTSIGETVDELTGPDNGEYVPDELGAEQKDDEGTSLFHTIGEPRQNNREDTGAGVDRDREQVGLVAVVAQIGDDGGQEGRHAVDGASGRPVDKDSEPDLPVGERAHDVFPLERVAFGFLGVMAVPLDGPSSLHTMGSPRSLLGSEELGFGGGVGDEEEGGETDDDGYNSLLC